MESCLRYAKNKVSRPIDENAVRLNVVLQANTFVTVDIHDSVLLTYHNSRRHFLFPLRDSEHIFGIQNLANVHRSTMRLFSDHIPKLLTTIRCLS